MQTNQQQLVPALRFPEFEGEWKRVKLGEIGEFKGGGTPSTKKESYWIGNIPWVSSSDLEEGNIHKINISKYITEEAIDNSATKLLPVNSILMVSRVGVGKLAINKVAICTSQDFSNFISKNCHVHYVGFYLEHHKAKLKNLSQGTSIKGFTLDVIRIFKINIPSQYAEQQKIAHLFSTIDKKKALLEELTQYLKVLKKGLMQQLFSQQVRFLDENGEAFPAWEVKLLKNLLKIPPKKKAESFTADDLLTVKLHLKGVAKNTNTKTLKLGSTSYYIRKAGDFIFGKQNLFNGAFAIIPKEFDNFLSSGDLPCLRFDPQINGEYFLHFFSRKSYYRSLEKIAQGTGSKRIHEKTIFSLKIPLPTLPEQKKIANLLSSLDRRIQNLQAQLEEMQEYKKGLLQQMLV